ncbi:MAG: hypothetical protein KatS3mg031_0430 [Chitinophagales bacterium]|nr:MAG: hypothetical protein KatS3mg031_0430 [Chitinophagales bacterium]
MPVFLVSLIGLALLAYAVNPYGIGISEDSVSYLAAAKSFMEQGKILTLGGYPSTRWAPLYPVILAFLQKLPVSLGDSMTVFNGLLYVFTVWTAWKIMRFSITIPLLQWAALVSISWSFAWIQAFASMWTEPLFLFLIHFVVLLLFRYYHRSHSGLWFLLGMVTGLAILQRYPGIFLLPVVCFFVFWKTKDLKSLLLATSTAAIALLPISIWLIRNYLLTETLTGQRIYGGYLFWKNMLVLADTLTSWFVPVQVPLALRIILVFPPLLLLFIWILRSRKLQNNIHLLLIASYLLILIISYLTDIEEPRDRLLSPVLTSLYVLVFSGLQHLVTSSMRPAFPSWIWKAMVLIWLLYPTSRILKNAHHWHVTGVTIYNDPAWQQSGTIHWLKQHELEGRSFSNDIFAIYYFTGRRSGFVPKTLYKRRFPVFYQSVKPGDYLIWFENKTWYRWHNLGAIQQKLKMQEIHRFNDGRIFVILENNISPSES